MAGELGMEIDLPLIPVTRRQSRDLTPSQTLYSESCGRFIVTVAPDRQERFEAIFSGMNIGRIGVITQSPMFIVRGEAGAPLVREDIAQLKESWKRPFGELI
jgi:phosphoribosylformylglycinamidine (FGAM) synthase-like enzyme